MLPTPPYIYSYLDMYTPRAVNGGRHKQTPYSRTVFLRSFFQCLKSVLTESCVYLTNNMFFSQTYIVIIPFTLCVHHSSGFQCHPSTEIPFRPVRTPTPWEPYTSHFLSYLPNATVYTHKHTHTQNLM